MVLKRHYRKDDTGVLLQPPVLDHIEVKHTGAHPEQNLSDTLVMNGLREGWLSITAGVLTLHAKPEDLRYRIVRTPGKYPSEASPVGYEVIHAYECVLDAEQHARFSVSAKGGGRG